MIQKFRQIFQYVLKSQNLRIGIELERLHLLVHTYLVVINFQYFCFCFRWDMTTEETPNKASKTLGSTTPGSATPADASTTPGKKVYLLLNLKN